MRVLAALALLGAADPPGQRFELQYLTVLGRRQATLYHDFDGDGRPDLLNATIDFDSDPPGRWLAFHLNDGGEFHGKPDFLRHVSDRAGALVFGDFLPGGGVEAGFLAEDGVHVWPWRDGAPAERAEKLLHAATFFRSPSLEQLPVWSRPTDLDADGRHDLLVPLADGYRVYFQTAPGRFGRTATLEADLREGRPRTVEPTAFAHLPQAVAAQFLATVSIPRLQAVDVNGDRLLDLLLIRGDEIAYFMQSEPGMFPSRRPHRTAYEIPTLREEEEKGTVHLSLVKFEDLNRDGLADLIVTRIRGKVGLWDSIKTSIFLHMGNGRGNFRPDRRIVIDGVSLDPWFLDMNGDGRLDAVTSRLRTDLMRQALEGILLGDIAVSYEVFQFDPGEDTFRPDPVYEKRVLIPRRDLQKTGAGSVPLVFVRGDLSGDGRPDMAVVDPKEEKLLIHPGRDAAGRIDFDGTPHWRVPVSRHPNGLEVRDVNGDGLNDVVLHHAGTLGLVLARPL